ncbi:hypothetical protein ZWY2020_050956 [Hordeum vulgare]|nr:hypothetical protein ZWY2020_050956 [Hordeum vulgare]
MDGEGDGAHGLEEQAAVAAEAARELLDAAAALAARRAADEDVLRRRAVAPDADVRCLHGCVAPLDPAAVDKLRLQFIWQELKSGNKPRVVGKRTPRVPVASIGGSPQVSQASGRSSGQMFLSPGKSIDRKNADSEMGSSKMHGFQVEDYPEDELSALDALHTLADISVNILQPSSIAESG